MYNHLLYRKVRKCANYRWHIHNASSQSKVTPTQRNDNGPDKTTPKKVEGSPKKHISTRSNDKNSTSVSTCNSRDKKENQETKNKGESE